MMNKEDYEEYCRTGAWMQLEEDYAVMRKEEQDRMEELKDRQDGW